MTEGDRKSLEAETDATLDLYPQIPDQPGPEFLDRVGEGVDSAFSNLGED
ncbi:hypothetical protein [Gluconobacter sphaericus]|uniref:Uncharacterized protein n=1 Tax=Gluconobacter sphaericus NBRC 12467 TaxID=1307951 RepID=A0AA37WC21_9PROT|nr:hypothetical protein [Gluconobacter sphaericus]GBR56483.1 hypothetical protein AA12467_2634 [Gluconobacter sphaericus NBRC 12467]GEB42768.1 hypothetical protein GSP01_15500 [Gluconobacter sphaericus NBRC 12467]GLQ84744.1 hypothetical protein GCM10007872_16520 [Gluconobacter sphaericus NBRC 12467]GLQ85101.1 hypothetical protein GCM10007872_20090 [Gluconobacter sphaericus NBRC 12467]